MTVSVGDLVRYRGRKAIVCVVHANGSVNLVYGTDHSDNSDGIWPVANDANVPANQIEAIDDQSVAEDDEADDAGDTGDGGDVSTEGDVVIKDYDGPEGFVNRTPVADVASDIRSGDYDDVLDAIEAAEAGGKDRDTVYEAIESRR